MNHAALATALRWRVHGLRVAQLAGGRATATLVQAVTLIWLARITGPQEFGALSIALAATAFTATLGDYGLGTLILRTRAQGSLGYLQEILSVSARLLASTSVIATVGIAILSLEYGFTMWLALLGVASAIEKLLDNTLMISVADGHTRVVALSLVARRATTFLGLAIANVVDAPAVPGYCVGYFVASISAFATNYRQILAVGGLRRRSREHRVLRAGLPFFVSGMSSQLRTLDSVIAGVFSGVTAAGGYSAASRLMSPIALLTNSLSPVVMPEAARRSPEFARTAAKSILRLVSLASAALTPSLLFGGGVMELVFGPAYAPMGSTLAVLLIAAPWVAGASLLEAIAQSQGLERHAAWVSVILGIGQVIAMSATAMMLGVLGLACAVLVTTIIRTALMLLVIRLHR